MIFKSFVRGKKIRKLIKRCNLNLRIKWDVKSLRGSKLIKYISQLKLSKKSRRIQFTWSLSSRRWREATKLNKKPTSINENASRKKRINNKSYLKITKTNIIFTKLREKNQLTSEFEKYSKKKQHKKRIKTTRY